MKTTRKERFLQAMLTSPNVTQAAKKADITRQTASKYMKEPGFQERLAEERAKVLESTRNFLSGHMLHCAYELMRIVTDQETPPAVKVQAINAVFGSVARMTDDAEIMERLIILERKISK